MVKSNKGLIKKAKQILMDQKSEIVKKYSHQSDEIDLGTDDCDYVQASILANTHSSIALFDKRKIARIDAALHKISSGSFGSCENCGESIDDKRLLFNPSFPHCISCAEEIELERKRTAR